MAFLDRKGLLNSTQHGFRNGSSCMSALLNVFDNLMNMIDSSQNLFDVPLLVLFIVLNIHLIVT